MSNPKLMPNGNVDVSSVDIPEVIEAAQNLADAAAEAMVRFLPPEMIERGGRMGVATSTLHAAVQAVVQDTRQAKIVPIEGIAFLLGAALGSTLKGEHAGKVYDLQATLVRGMEEAIHARADGAALLFPITEGNA